MLAVVYSCPKLSCCSWHTFLEVKWRHLHTAISNCTVIVRNLPYCKDYHYVCIICKYMTDCDVNVSAMFFFPLLYMDMWVGLFPIYFQQVLVCVHV